MGYGSFRRKSSVEMITYEADSSDHKVHLDILPEHCPPELPALPLELCALVGEVLCLVHQQLNPFPSRGQ